MPKGVTFFHLEGAVMSNSRETLLSVSSLDEETRQEMERRNKTLKEVLTSGDIPISMPVQFLDNPIAMKKKKKRKSGGY